MVAGKIETITINKTKNTISISKRNMLCIRNETVRSLSEVFAFNCFKKGHEGVWVRTIEYVIKAEFTKHRTITILTSRSRKKITR